MKSMTGYGRAKLQKESREYIVEIKSVNHKYLDMNINSLEIYFVWKIE